MKSLVTLFIDAKDGQTCMSREFDIPVKLNGGDGIGVCDCCDPIQIDEDNGPPTWNVILGRMEYTCWVDATSWGPLLREIEHFRKWGFVEHESTREMTEE